jgi:hypothetical protein
MKAAGRRSLGATVGMYLPVVIGVPGCFAAGWFELTRALGGREIAWVYAIEWPLYGITGMYMWWRLRRAHESTHEPAAAKPVRMKQVRVKPVRTIAADDPGLAAWQDYLDRLQEADPPGGPPPTR